MAALPQPISPLRRSYVPLRLAIVAFVAALIAVIFAPPVAIALVASSAALVGGSVARHRIQRRRFERRHGFLPERGRDDLPRSGRTTLYRVELGQRGPRVCVMVARWRFAPTGWERDGVVDQTWVDGDDPVAFGEARRRTASLLKQLTRDPD